MLRILLALSLVAVLLLAASLIGPLVGLGGRHRRLGLLAVGATVMVHGLSALSLGWSGRRVAARARRPGGPGWMEAQARRNRCKALACQSWGLGLIAVAAWSGWDGSAPWHRGLSALAVGFQPGAFAGEALMVAAQGRLVREVEGWSGEV